MASACADLGLGRLEMIEAALGAARGLFEAGGYAGARGMLLSAREDAYQAVTAILAPLHEQALKNPRNSTIPLVAMNSIGNSRSALSRGDLVEGRSYLSRALRNGRRPSTIL